MATLLAAKIDLGQDGTTENLEQPDLRKILQLHFKWKLLRERQLDTNWCSG